MTPPTALLAPTFGQRIVTLRAALGLTQTALAQALGVSRRAIGDWESGRSFPKPEHLKTLIALAVRANAFPAARAANEIRTLWRAAQTKVLLDEQWLAALLSAQTFPSPSSAPLAAPARLPAEIQFILPAQTTVFVGRTAELGELGRLVTNPACRLLTLLGPGGIGKTRLALQVAEAQAYRFAGGAVFVPLAPVGSPQQIASAIADEIHLALGGHTDPAAQLLTALRSRDLLLVLDNFEHLLSGADLVQQILAQAPAVTILVTSRERLNLQAEWLFDVSGLAYPPRELRGAITLQLLADLSAMSAIELFARRAARVRPGFALTADNVATIARICRYVQGMPLAIELAAAGVRILPVTAIEQQIRTNLDALATTLRDVPARHRSLRAVFDHSWDLMSVPEQALLSRLAVFRGGASLDAAQQVAGATLSALTALFDKSLVRQTNLTPAEEPASADETASSRVALLEPIREYALEKLTASGQADALQRAHAVYFTHLSETLSAQWDSPHSLAAAAQLDRDYDNLRAAFRWARDNRAIALGLQLAVSLRKYWQRRGYYTEGRLWLKELLELPHADEDTNAIHARLQALHTAAWLASDQHDYAQATELFQASMQLRQDLGEIEGAQNLLAPAARQARAAGQYARATQLLQDVLARHRAANDRGSLTAGGLGLTLYELGLALREQGDYVQAEALFQEDITLHRALGDREGLAIAILGLADIARDRGDVAPLQHYAQMSLEMCREIGIQWAEGFALNNLALAALMQNNLPQALTLANECVALFRQMHADGALPEVLLTLGQVQRAQNDLAAAYPSLTEALRLALRVGPRFLVAQVLEGLADTLTQPAQSELAVRLIAAAAALRAQMGTPVRIIDQPPIDRTLETARRALGLPTYTAVWTAAGQQPLQEILQEISVH